MADTSKVKKHMETVKFSDLPLDKSHPHHSAWVWGPDDGLGTLNYLTNDLVQSASKEIQSGTRVCLNWDMTHPKYPGFGRQAFEHKIHRKGEYIVCDDTVHFNTQSGSQWDGFRHFGYQKEQIFYNNTTMEQVLDPKLKCGAGMAAGIGEWAKAGIAGRGVLLDVYGYCESIGESYDPWTTHPISLATLQACAKHQGVTFQAGDMLLIRSGYHVGYEKATEQQILAKSKAEPGPAYAGVEQDINIAEWVFNNKFAAVAGDAPAFEAWPVDPKPFGGALHEIFLGGWGMPIGEMWYLEELVKICKGTERWSFFLSSSPLNVPGGVATSPNVMAMF